MCTFGAFAMASPTATECLPRRWRRSIHPPSRRWRLACRRSASSASASSTRPLHPADGPFDGHASDINHARWFRWLRGPRWRIDVERCPLAPRGLGSDLLAACPGFLPVRV